MTSEASADLHGRRVVIFIDGVRLDDGRDVRLSAMAHGPLRRIRATLGLFLFLLQLLDAPIP
ncbi:MAG: hypothetical protein ACSLFQ_05500 [Thermoanaerobaculia bacterium]